MALPPTSMLLIHQEDRNFCSIYCHEDGDQGQDQDDNQEDQDCCFNIHIYCRGDECSTFALLPYWATYFVTVSVVSENGSCWNNSLNKIFNYVDI